MRVSKWGKRILILVLLGAVAVIPVAGGGSAATVTSGSFTYLINGEETSFPFDPVVKKDGYLLPVDVFQALGIRIQGPNNSKQVVLTRGNVSVTANLGQPLATLDNGSVIALTPMPARISGRPFLPVQILAEFGIDVQTDTSILQLRDLGASLNGITPVTDAGPYNNQKAQTSVLCSVKGVENFYIQTEFTVLTPTLAASPLTITDFGLRSRLLKYLDSNTVVLVHLTNTSTRGVTFDPTKIYLVDANGVQYEYSGTELDLQGSILTKTAPNAQKWGVMLFPKITGSPTSLTFYADANPQIVGSISLPLPN